MAEQHTAERQATAAKFVTLATELKARKPLAGNSAGMTHQLSAISGVQWGTRPVSDTGGKNENIDRGAIFAPFVDVYCPSLYFSIHAIPPPQHAIWLHSTLWKTSAK